MISTGPRQLKVFELPKSDFNRIPAEFVKIKQLMSVPLEHLLSEEDFSAGLVLGYTNRNLVIEITTPHHSILWDISEVVQKSRVTEHENHHSLIKLNPSAMRKSLSLTISEKADDLFTPKVEWLESDQSGYQRACQLNHH